MTVSTAERIATRGKVQIRLGKEIDGILNDVPFIVEVRENIDCRIGHENGICIGRHIHYKHMANTAVGPQSIGLGRDAPHQFVRVQAALHQHFAAASVNQFDSFGSGRLAVRSVDDFEAADIEAVLARRILDFGFRSDQHGTDDARFRAVEGASQRGLVARMYDNGRHRRKGLVAAIK